MSQDQALEAAVFPQQVLRHACDHSNGQICFLYGTLENANTRIRPPSQAKRLAHRRAVRTAQSSFVVTYTGFTPKAREAFQYAIDIWNSFIQSPVPIRIDAEFVNLGGPFQGITILGSAHPLNRFSVTSEGLWHPVALANKIVELDLDSGYDMKTSFYNHAEVDWYFGTDGNTPLDQYDFVSVVLHEIAHGLAFTSRAGDNFDFNNPVMPTMGKLRDGSQRYPYIYDSFVVNGDGTAITSFADPSVDLLTQFTSDNLFWDGTQGKAGNSGSRPKLYAPSSWKPSSSYIHVDEDTYPPGSVNSLMTPYINKAEAVHHPGPIVLGMLEDMGWTINTPPKFATDTTTRSVAENTAADVNIGAAVSAMDEDSNDTLTYSLRGSDAASFAIESTTGQLKTLAALNYEIKDTYTLTVVVDDGVTEDTIEVTINVTNVNDPPMFATNSTTREILEGTSANQNIDAPVVATDEDLSDTTLTYSLGGTDAGSFSIERTTGQLKTKSALNYATKSTYEITVIATDSRNLTGSIRVTINVIKIVDFTDTALASAVRSALGIASNASILSNALALLASLSAIRDGISDLIGLEYAVGLTSLNLSNNDIVNLQYLSGLSNLITLNLSGNAVVNLTHLSSLNALSNLDLSNNSITDVSALSGLTNLTRLNLTGNSGITNPEQLYGLEQGGTTIIGVDVPDPVDIPDTNLAASLRSALGIPSSVPIFPEEMLTLTTFSASNQSIVNLLGLEEATELTTLDLGDNSIVNLSPLSGLTSLTSLDLADNEIVSVSPLRNLSSLERLYLDDNEIETVSSLSGLSSLKRLELRDNDIMDATPLSTMTHLTYLYLRGNDNLTNIKYLVKLTNTTIDIVLPDPVNIPDANLASALRSALSIPSSDSIFPEDIETLTTFRATNKSIVTLTGLEEATSLTTLDLGDNSIVNLSPLSGLTSLTSLDLADNEIVSVSPLRNLTSLERLYLDDNEIENVSALSGLSRLTRLELRDNDIMDATPLSTMTHLTHLYLRGNDNLTNIKRLLKLTSTSVDINLPDPVEIPDTNLASALRTTLRFRIDDPILPEEMEQLTNLTASGRNIANLTGLETATDLTNLTLSNNAITDLDPLSDLTRLTDLNLSNNKIEDLSPLEELRNLETLDLRNNQITDVAPLAELTSLTLLQLAGNTILNPGALYRLKRDGTTITGVDIPDSVVFDDANLEAAVKRALQIAAVDPILPDTLATLTSLTASNKEITSLRGLEDASLLETLDVGQNELSDLTPLSGLTHLEVLDLADNEITNVRVLSGLSNLRTLDLRRNDVGDIAVFSTMTHLRYLYLSGNSAVTSLRGPALRPLVKLKEGGTRVDITLPSPVNIADANLKAALRSALSLQTDDPIFPEDMATLTTFSAPNQSIVSLTGLQTATGLTRLDLPGNAIVSLSPLSRLTNLTSLDLSSNQISNISWLSNLAHLTSLNLSSNKISSVSSLSPLTRLTSLNLSTNQITSVSSLSGLSNLTNLNLSDNRITNVLPLQGLSSLRTLDLSGNTGLTEEKAQVLYKLVQGGTTITVPDGVTLPLLSNIVVFNNANLEAVVRSALRIATGYPVLRSKITEFTRLTATYKQIDDLTGLEGASALTTLDLGNNAIVKLGPLQNLSNLVTLDLADNEIEALGPLSGLSRLTGLDLDDNEIADVSALSGLSGLQTLDLRGNDVMDVTPLKDLTSLTYIYLSGNENLENLEWLGALENLWSDIRLPDVVGLPDTSLDAAVRTALRTNGHTVSNDLPMSEELLESLETLTASNRGIENLTGCEHMTELTSLDLRNNQISDVTPLSKLYSLEMLLLDGNPILDTSVLRELERRGTSIDITIYRYPFWDVNQDGRVNEADVFLITLIITGESPDVNGDGNVDGDDEAAADANKDGRVDTDDLLLVFEKQDRPVNLGAPLLSTESGVMDWELLEHINVEQLRVHLAILGSTGDGAANYKGAVAFLEAVLIALQPSQTLLLPNYPNPFNPETWIPYQLARGSDVRIIIYDVHGAVIRRLELGYHAEGYYRIRSRAARWDGRNEMGERVASGIYLYQLETDNISLLRKMVILK